MNVILEGTQLNQYYFGMKLIVMRVLLWYFGQEYRGGNHRKVNENNTFQKYKIIDKFISVWPKKWVIL